MGEILNIVKKGNQQITFIFFGIGEPLFGIPAAIFIGGSSNQIQDRRTCGKAAGFNIYKQYFLKRSDFFQRIANGK